VRFVDMEVSDAIKVLTAAGAVFSLPPVSRRSLSMSEMRVRLGFSPDWVVKNLKEFPNAWRAPGGGRNGGELRIPERDVEAFEQRRRVNV